MKEIDKMFDDLEESINKPKKMVHVGFIIDASGSMNHLRNFVVDTFNEQLETLKNETDETLETKVSLIVFDYPNRIEFLRWENDVADVEKLGYEEYKPEGSTALYDAIGMTLDRYRELPDYMNETSSFLLMIITDGFENASVHYNPKQIKSLLDELQATKRWTVTYFGADQRTMVEGFNIPVYNTKQFVADEFTTGVYTMQTNCATRSYMDTIKAGGTSVSNYYQDIFTSTDNKSNKKTKKTTKK